MVFECAYKAGKTNEKWKGKISLVKDYGSHFEFWIESRSTIRVLCGKSSSGGFACMPDFQVGCYLVNIKNRFWNREKLSGILGDVDGITVEAALYSIADKIIF